MLKFQSKDLLSIKDLQTDEIFALFELTKRIKRDHKKGKVFAPLKGKSLAMIFSKQSTRTRLSFETGIYQLGGNGIFLNAQEMQLGRGETIADTAKVLSRFVDGIMIRTFSHQDVVSLAQHATIPVINGLTDFVHPCQILTDLFTAVEKGKKIGPSFHVIYVGDGNNIAHSWFSAAMRLGFRMTFIVPEQYNLADEIFSFWNVDRKRLPANIAIEHAVVDETIRSADVLYTDVWVSMGQDAERERKKSILRPYQINQSLIDKAKKDVLVMHCLPAHRGEEISAEAMDGPHSVVFDEAENRLHVQKALMTVLMS
jgi:ornithine carbamoyltransferase